MVESKIRKGAFLREAVRKLKLANVRVESRRFEELLTDASIHECCDVVTIRAVRVQLGTLVSTQGVPSNLAADWRCSGGLAKSLCRPCRC